MAVAGSPAEPTCLEASDTPDPEAFWAMFHALDACSIRLVGPATPRLLIIPVRDDSGHVAGGLWGHTQFRWLQIEMLVVPEPLRARGVGSALIAAAELEARRRGCIGSYVDTFSFQAVSFYQKLGFTLYGVLENFPPGHQRLYFCKRFADT